MHLCNIYNDLEPVNIEGVTSDSRDIKNNFIFVAVHEEYINIAIESGAKVIITNSDLKIGSGVIVKKISGDLRKELARISSVIYYKKPKNIIAVTGTNGKTSFAHFCTQIWKNLGFEYASIGTLGILASKDIKDKYKELFNEEFNYAGLTTPNSPELHKYLHCLKELSIDNVVIEASSHGLDQYRLDYIDFKFACFTNFTQDHLDYHETLEGYFNAKMRVFDLLKGQALVSSRIKEFSKDSYLTYGPNTLNRVVKNFPNEKGQKVLYEIYGNKYEVDLKLIGDFQAENLLAAIIMINQINEITINELLKIASEVETVKGRMQIVGKNNLVVIDYAHTPDALEKAIITIKSHINNLILVFGCGGNRDKGKRRKMGEIANLANIVIVTDDNPRNEDPALIRKEIISGDDFLEIPSRKDAIFKALDLLKEDWGVLIAGKGHEDYQIIGDKRFHFSDKEAVEEYYG